MTAYLLLTRPFDDPCVNRLELFNELCVMWVAYHQIILAGFVFDFETKETVANSMIGVIALLLGVNVLISGIQQMLQAKLRIKRWWLRRKHLKRVQTEK